MANKSASTSHRKPSRYVVAMMLGTALSSLSAAPVLGSARPEVASQAISDISRYCTVCWRNARLDPECWNDCTQEVFCRLLERVAPDGWGRLLKVEGEDRREFLRAIDAVKKRTQRSRRWATPLAEESLADRRDSCRRRIAEERATMERAAADLLSPRQQRILKLSADGWSVREIGTSLELPAERVSDEKYKAIGKLREHFGPDAGNAGNGSDREPALRTL